MKKYIINLLIVIVCIAIIIIILIMNYKPVNAIEPAYETSIETAVLPTNTPTPTNTCTPTPTPVIETAILEEVKCNYYEDYLWVGHSRVEGMAECIDINSIAKCSQGLSWLKNKSSDLYEYREYTIVINIGINDLYNVNKYIDYFNSLPDEFIANNYIFIMSENPVDEDKESKYGYSIKNSELESFNKKIKDNLPKGVYFIDTYSYLQNNGFSTVDGIHYTNDTYKKIYNYVKKTIEK